jgi:hypothetical protein
LEELVGLGYGDIQVGVMLAGGEDAAVHDLVVLDGASAVGAVFEFYDDGGDGGGPDGAAAAGAEVVEGKGCGWFGVFHVECCVAGKNAANGERFLPCGKSALGRL